MKLYLNNNINPDEWNRLVGAHVFHRYEWRWVIEKAYGLKPSFAMAIDKGNFALFPSFRINNYCLSMPFTYVTGFLTNSPSLSKKIERHFNLENYSLRYKAIQKNDIENGQITAIVEIKGLDDFLSNLSRNMRNQLRHSERQEFIIERQKNTEQFYPLYCRKMHEHGTPAHKRIFFDEILRYFETAAIYTTMKDGIAVASMLCIDGKDVEKNLSTRYILWAAAVSQKEAAFANYFTYWSVIKDAIMLNLDQIDLGTAQFGSSQHAFKKKWHPTIFKIEQIGWTKRHYKESLIMRLASIIWKHLPLTLVNWLGPYLRKYLT